MANIVVRRTEPADEEGAWNVRSLTYNDGVPVPEERRVHRFSEGYVGLVDGEVAGVFHVLSMNATRGLALLGCGGVAGVAVSPEKRRSGVGGAMMDWLPGYLRERGVALASLYAFREPFYRRSGYEVCGTRRRITCATHRLPKVESDLPVSRLTPDDWRRLAPCYEAFAHERAGLHVRNEIMWGRVLNEHKPLTIYAVGDPIEGYVAIRHKTDFWVEQGVSEFVWSTPRGYEGLMVLLRQLGINKTAVAWHEPSDSPFYARYLDQGIDVRLERPIMFRLCDVRGGLAALKPEGTGEFRIEVLDEQVPANRGPWRVSFGDRKVAVEPASEADLVIDIRPLVQAFLGEPSLEQLARMGLVEVKHRAALEAACRLLSPLSAYCLDFF